MTEFERVCASIPEWLIDCPVAAEWWTFKGETYFAMVNVDRSLKAGRPMIDLSYCATKAMNGIVLKTVQYSKKHFKKSKLEIKK